MTAGWVITRAVGVVAAAAAVGCTGSGNDRSSLPGGPPVVSVTMTEYDFDHATPVPAGRVVFRFVNDGRLVHQPDLLPLPEDLPPIDEQLRGEQRSAIAPFAGIPPREPGEVGTYAVDLVPGRRYAFICFARDPDDDDSHALKGMTAEFRAGGGTKPPLSTTIPAPSASTTTG